MTHINHINGSFQSAAKLIFAAVFFAGLTGFRSNAQAPAQVDFHSLEEFFSAGDLSQPLKTYDTVNQEAMKAFRKSFEAQKGKTVTFTFVASSKARRTTETRFSVPARDKVQVGDYKFGPDFIMEVSPDSTESAVEIAPATTVAVTATFDSIGSLGNYFNSNSFHIVLTLHDAKITLLGQAAPPSSHPPVAVPQKPASALPQPAPVKSSSKLVLANDWNTKMQGGTATMDDLGRLFGGVAKAGVNLDGDDSIKIYQDVAYLTPIRTAMAALKLGNPPSKVLIACPGFPRDSFFYYAVDGRFDDGYTRMYLVVDRADQLVSVEFVNEAPGKYHTPHKDFGWHTYDFVNSRVKGSPTLAIDHQIDLLPLTTTVHMYDSFAPAITPKNQAWKMLRVDSTLLQPIRGSKNLVGGAKDAKEDVRWFVPRPIVELVLSCVQTPAR